MLYYKSFTSGIALIIIFMLSCANDSLANEFSVRGISEDLKRNANAVYRINNQEVTIRRPDRYTVKYEVAVTIMNENGRNAGVFFIPYDSYSQPRFRGGEIYDSNGNQINRIRRRDLEDHSFISGFSLYDENRITYYVPRMTTYPYTVRYEYEVNYSRGLFYAMTFFPNANYRRSTEKATLRISYPSDIGIYYQEFNLGEIASKTKDNNEIVWEFSNLPAIRKEHLSPSRIRVLPGIKFTANEFAIDGYHGSNESWKEFGKWVWSLIDGLDDLPASTVDKLERMTEGLETKKEKIEAIYSYMQSRTRYVNISLGIGGLKPFDAQTVDQTGYGDCKALTNYMMAMLKAVNIDSYYTLVYGSTGGYEFYPDFITNQFNHVILCVPLENDTIWLENTNQSIPFGYLGSHTDNRSVLIIKEDGGVLTKTPSYSLNDNNISTTAKIKLDPSGSGSADIHITYGGHYFSRPLSVARQNNEEQIKWLYSNDYLPDYSITNHSIATQNEYFTPQGFVEFNANLRSYASTSRNRLFVPLAVLSSKKELPPRIRNRSNPFELKFERSYNDTITFILPEGFAIESSPSDVFLESEFGTYKANFEIKQNKIVYTRSLKELPGYFPPEKYQDFFEFRQNINRADSQSFILVRE